MIKISMQFFAHKKGMGSTKNGRDSESKRLGVRELTVSSYWLVTSSFVREVLTFTQARTLRRVLTILCSQQAMVL